MSEKRNQLVREIQKSSAVHRHQRGTAVIADPQEWRRLALFGAGCLGQNRSITKLLTINGTVDSSQVVMVWSHTHELSEIETNPSDV